MTFISLDVAAQRLGVPKETIEGWVQQGLLSVHRCRKAHPMTEV